jgi:hypothetical protein
MLDLGLEIAKGDKYSTLNINNSAMSKDSPLVACAHPQTRSRRPGDQKLCKPSYLSVKQHLVARWRRATANKPSVSLTGGFVWSIHSYRPAYRWFTVHPSSRTSSAKKTLSAQSASYTRCFGSTCFSCCALMSLGSTSNTDKIEHEEDDEWQNPPSTAPGRLIGRAIRIWWDGDATFYEAQVTG